MAPNKSASSATISGPLNWLTSSNLRSFTLFLLLLPLLTLIFLPLLLLTHFKNFLLKRLLNLTPLTPHDSIFAVDKCHSGDDPTLNSSFASNVTLIFCDGDVNITDLRARFLDLLTKPTFSRLRTTLVKTLCGFYLKPVDSVDIKAHVRLVRDFDAVGLSTDHVRELEEYVGQVVMTRVFPPGQPLWEVELFRRFKNHQSVVLIRIHHTLCDGYSFNHLVDQLIHQESRYLVKDDNQKGSSSSRDDPSCWKALLSNVSLVYSAPRLLFKLYEESVLVPKRNLFTSRKTGRRGYFSMTTFDLNRYKLIRRRTRSHFASVGMTLMVGALGRFLREKSADSNTTVPPTVSIMHSLPKPRHPLTRLVNHWNVGLFKNAMGVVNPLRRLHLAEEDFNKYTTKDRVQDVLDYHMPMLGLLPSKFIELLFSLNFGTGMGFTSVPAYEGHAHLLGKHSVKHMCKVFGLQWRQTAVASAVYTHNGEVGFTMFGHEDVVKSQADIERIVKVHLRDEFEELFKLTEDAANAGGRFFA